MKNTVYMAMFVASDDGLNIPYAADPECAGALQCFDSKNPPILFNNKTEARQAIRVSTKYAELCRAQGKTVNEDFLYGAKSVEIIPVRLPNKPA